MELDSKFLVLSKDKFQAFLKENALISFNMLKIISHRLRNANREITQIKTLNYFAGITIIPRADRCLSCRSCEIACAVSKSQSHSLFDAINEEPLKHFMVRSR